MNHKNTIAVVKDIHVTQTGIAQVNNERMDLMNAVGISRIKDHVHAIVPSRLLTLMLGQNVAARFQMLKQSQNATTSVICYLRVHKCVVKLGVES
jgi:ABC-type proline/glycine betaine transport system permease subunit